MLWGLTFYDLRNAPFILEFDISLLHGSTHFPDLLPTTFTGKQTTCNPKSPLCVAISVNKGPLSAYLHILYNSAGSS